MKKLSFIFLIAVLSGCSYAKSPDVNALVYAGNAQQWTSDHDPGAVETTTLGSVLIGDTVYNTVDNTFWRNKDNTQNAMAWSQLWTSDSFTPPVLDTPRNYSSVSLALNTSRTPSSTGDVFVVASISQINILGSSTTANAQIDCGAGFSTIAPISENTGVVSNKQNSISFIVPINCAYKITNGGDGTVSISSINELQL